MSCGHTQSELLVIITIHISYKHTTEGTTLFGPTHYSPWALPYKNDDYGMAHRMQCFQTIAFLWAKPRRQVNDINHSIEMMMGGCTFSKQLERVEKEIGSMDQPVPPSRPYSTTCVSYPERISQMCYPVVCRVG